MLVGLNSQWFLRCPRSGVLHFDYVSTTRPLVGEAILLCSAVLSSPLVVYAIFYFGLLCSTLPCSALLSPLLQKTVLRLDVFLSVPCLPFSSLLFPFLLCTTSRCYVIFLHRSVTRMLTVTILCFRDIMSHDLYMWYEKQFSHSYMYCFSSQPLNWSIPIPDFTAISFEFYVIGRREGGVSV